jgi:DUF4097 and DUF4098 domain-containing protein YvlB
MWLVLATLLLTSSVDATAAADVTDRQTKVIALPDGRPLVIEITVGNVRIEGWDKSDVEITVERRAPSAAQLSRLPLSIAEVPPGVVVRALQTDNTNDPAFRSDVTVRVPRAATIERVAVVEGRITIEGFSGTITGFIRRGPIDAKDISGTIRLQTEIGAVTLTNATLSPNGLLRLRTFNGDVKLALAERPHDARVLALALNGSIKSDIPLFLKESWGPRWGEATLGKGEPLISVDVVTGTVEIKSP